METANGLEVRVRYIPRAPQRNAVLFQVIVDVLHKGAQETVSRRRVTAAL